jgi:hypothetical protein
MPFAGRDRFGQALQHASRITSLVEANFPEATRASSTLFIGGVIVMEIFSAEESAMVEKMSDKLQNASQNVVALALG